LALNVSLSLPPSNAAAPKDSIECGPGMGPSASMSTLM